MLGETLGSIVYQEQMMRLGTVMAGFTPVQASRLRKAVSKKNPAEMAAVGALFAAGCAVQTRGEDGAVRSPVFAAATATRVWDAMKHAAAFAFNKSHSYAYGTLAYTTAYLKANWPVAYGAAVLGVATRDDKRQQAFDDLADDGILAVQLRARVEHDVQLAVCLRRFAHVSEAHRELHVLVLRRNLGDADRFAARRLGTAAPECALLWIAALRIAKLHEKTRNGAMHTLAVVEARFDQLRDVLDRHGSFLRECLNCEGSLRGVNDDERSSWLGGRRE